MVQILRSTISSTSRSARSAAAATAFASATSASAAARSFRPAALILTLRHAPAPRCGPQARRRPHRRPNWDCLRRPWRARSQRPRTPFSSSAGDLRGVRRRRLQSRTACRLLLVGRFGHGENGHDAVERRSIFIHQMQQLAQHACPFSAQPENSSQRSSQPALCDRGWRPSCRGPRPAPHKAAMEPPPGRGDSLAVSSANPLQVMSISRFF